MHVLAQSFNLDEMKQQQREIRMGDVLHFPKDIKYLHYKGWTLVVAVETANWLVLSGDNCVDFIDDLRSGKSVGEVFDQIINTEDRRSFIKLLTAIMARQFAGLDYEPLPEFVQGYKMLNIYLTNACNLSCPHCFMKAGKKLSNELTGEEWIRVLSDFKNNGGESVTITGGEPLLHSSFHSIIKSAYRQGLKTTVLTNGILWNDVMIDDLSPLLAEIQISIDGVDDESNGKVRQEGIFDQLVHNVIRFSKNGVRVSVASTFTSENIDCASRYAELVNIINEKTDNKVIFKLTKKILPGRGTHYTEAENIEYEKKIRQVEELADPNAKYEVFMEGHQPNMVAKNCGFGGLSIAADGEVYFCNRVLEIPSQGNVREHPIQFFIALGERAHRETSVENVIPCRNCPIRNICGGGCRIDDCDFKGGEWRPEQPLHQLKCQQANDYLLKMMVESYEYKYSF